MTGYKYIITVLLSIMFANLLLAQTPGETWSSNVTLKCKTDFGKGGVADVWGVQINGVNYALVTLDGGFSIVNTDNPSAPTERTYINKIGYSPSDPSLLVRLNSPDIETFIVNGITYAYLATNNTYDPDMPLVIIINLNVAINQGGQILIDPYNPSGSVYVGKINDFGDVSRSHTLTIDGGYLYVATLTDKIPVWNLNNSPTSPTYKGAITVTPSNSEVHEMYVKSTGASTSKIYAACQRGGVQLINLNLSNMSFSKTFQIYDSDKSSPALVNSADSYFEYRQTHSAWPTDNGQYIFTTDELSLWPPDSTQINMPDDPNLYIEPNVLRSVHRQGNFLRTWKASQLGSLNSLKSGFYVAENQHTGFVNLSDINNSFVPNSIHQMYGTGNALYVAHYTQGLRVIDISNPENLVEVGYYDDYPAINDTPYDPYFFRNNKWYQGIYGVYPDPNRPGIVYAGSLSDGFYIFDVLPIATPTGFTLSGSVGQNPTLSWNQSTDAGLEGYKLYQSIDGSPYSLLVTLNKNITSFVDNGVIIGNDKDDPSVCYYITAFNIAGKESDNSIPRCTKAGGLNKSGSEYAESNVPYTNYLGTAYPNPFNPTTKISFGLASAAQVRIIVYNTLGQEIAVLADNVLGEGNHEVEFNAKGLPSGIYLYKMEASGITGEEFNIVEIKKMIVSK